jgi:uncharacterized protein
VRTTSSLKVTVFLLIACSPSVSAAQSFECGEARTQSEIAICQNEHLSQLDEELALLYRAALQAGDPDSIKLAGRRLLAARQDCRGEIICLENGYQDSIEYFSDVTSPDNLPVMENEDECDDCGTVTAEKRPEPATKEKLSTSQTCEDAIGILIAALKLRQSGYDLLGTHEKVLSDIQGDERLAYIAEQPTFSSDIMDMVRLAYSGQFDGFDLSTVQAMMLSNCINQ